MRLQRPPIFYGDLPSVWFEHTTEYGTFVTSKMPWNERWDFSDDVLYKDGNIYWRTIKPAGILIKYRDGTKRFISEDFLHADL